MTVAIDVLGTPAPKGSARAFVNKRTGRAILAPGGSKVNGEKLKGWDGAVRDAAMYVVGWGAVPPFVDVPLVVAIVFRLARPGGHWGKGKRTGQLTPKAPGYPRGKPDIDKLARATLDSLTGIVFDDDSRIVQLLLAKQYAAPGREGARISVDVYEPGGAT